MVEKETFHSRLKEIRTELSITRAELARKAAVSEKTVAALEIGKRRGSLRSWERIVNALNLISKKQGLESNYYTLEEILAVDANNPWPRK